MFNERKEKKERKQTSFITITCKVNSIEVIFVP